MGTAKLWGLGVTFAAIVALSGCASQPAGPATTPPSGDTSVTPTLTPSATETTEPSGGSDTAAALAEQACQSYFTGLTSGGPNPDFSKNPMHADFTSAASFSKKAAASDPMWQPVADGAAAWLGEVDGELKESGETDDKPAVLLYKGHDAGAVVLRARLVCGAAFGLKQLGADTTKQHPDPYPLVTQAPDPFPTKPKEIAELACAAWAGVFNHEEKAVERAGDSSPFALAASWSEQAATGDSRWQDLADAMTAWIQVNRVDAIAAVPDDDLQKGLVDKDWAVLDACDVFGATWNGNY